MGKILHIKEFDIITDNPEFKDDKDLKYLEKEPFGELDKFVRRILLMMQPEKVMFWIFLRLSQKKV